MNKKSSVVLLCFVMVVFVFLPLASAQGAIGQQVSEAITSAIGAGKSVANPILSALMGTTESDEFFFAKVLLLILLFVIISVVLNNIQLFKYRKGVAFTVSIVISILAVRFIQENQLTKGILLPYGTLGVALTTILPFLIFFYFVHVTNMGGGGRRIAWIFFAITFIILWSYKYSELGPITNQIYLWTLIAIGVVFIFDKNIHYYFKTHEMSIFYRNARDRHLAALQAEYLNIINLDTPEAERRRKQIEEQARRLGHDISRTF